MGLRESRGLASEPGSGPDLVRLAKEAGQLSNVARLALLRNLYTPRTVADVSALLGTDPARVEQDLRALEADGWIKPSGDGPGARRAYVLAKNRWFEFVEGLRRVASGDPGAERAPLFETVGVLQVSRPSLIFAGPALIVAQGLHPGQVRRLAPPGPWAIGRDEGLFLTLDYDPFVSTRHVEVREQAGQHLLMDLSSRNGTFHNWERLPRGGQAPLKPGDVVGVGKTMLVYRR